MNHVTKYSFESILEEKLNLDRKILEVLNEYAATVDKARDVGKKFKDEEGYIADERNKAARKARSEMAAAQASFTAATRSSAKDLSLELSKALAEAPSDGFNRLFRTYSDLAIRPTRAQAQTLIDAAKGNILALQAVSQLLDRTEAPYRLKFNGPEVFEQDLTTIERFAQAAVQYPGPEACFHAACDVLSGQLITHTRPDGSTYTDGRTFDSVTLSIGLASFTSLANAVNQMSARWQTDVRYELIDSISAELRRNEEEIAEMAGEELPDEPESETSLDDKVEAALELAQAHGRAAAAGSPESIRKRLGDYVR